MLTQLFFATAAMAAEVASEQTSEAVSETIMSSSQLASPDMTGLDVGWGGYFQAIGMLFILLAIFAAFLFLIKRVGARAGFGFSGKGILKLEGQLPLGPKKSIAVVRFLNKRLVVGVTDNQINLLHETDADHEDPSHDFEKTLKDQKDRTS